MGGVPPPVEVGCLRLCLSIWKSVSFLFSFSEISKVLADNDAFNSIASSNSLSRFGVIMIVFG